MLKFSKNIIFILLVFAIVFSTGCLNKTVSTVGQANKTVAEVDETRQEYNKLFKLEIYSDKKAYKTTDKIKIWATLKYIGKNSHIKIWHGDPYISFYISNGKDFNIGGIVAAVLASTELEKEKLYRFDYSKSGGYSADDPKAEFWKKFYAEKDLYLPEGEYTIKVDTAFSLTEKQEANKSALSKELKIVVKPDSLNSKINNSENRGLNLNKNEIQRISISFFPHLFQAFDITDKGQISSVVDYLISLNQIDTNLNPKEYVGGGYTIKVQFENGTERVFNLFGNKFFTEKDSFTYEIPYQEAIKFDTIVASFLQDNLKKSGKLSLEGTIISKKVSQRGRDIACVIKDKDNATYNIDMGNANIIDATGNGWMILHENDVIRVFFQKGERIDDGSIVASAVYIQKSAQ